MKTKELLSLPVGTYVCCDEICNYLYILIVVKDGLDYTRYDVYEYIKSSIFDPHFSIKREWVDKNYSHQGKYWNISARIGGFSVYNAELWPRLSNLNILGRFGDTQQLEKDIKNFLIERICNSSNGDYRKRFLQDRLKQIVKNEKL